MQLSWEIDLHGTALFWLVGGSFFLAGLFLAVVLPPVLAAWVQPEDAGELAKAVVILRVLGGTFLGLGSVVLAMTLAGGWVRRHRPENLAAWHWWVNFTGGMLGAAAFAVPSALTLPAFWLLYLGRPNFLFPEGDPEAAKKLWLAGLFGVLGVTTLAAMYLLGRHQLRHRPRWTPGRGREARG